MNVPEYLKQEAAQVRLFMAGESELWRWLQAHLEKQQRELIGLASDLRLPPEARAIVIGRLALCQKILAEPARLLTIAEDSVREAEPYRHPHAPIGSPTAV